MVAGSDSPWFRLLRCADGGVLDQTAPCAFVRQLYTPAGNLLSHFGGCHLGGAPPPGQGLMETYRLRFANARWPGIRLLAETAVPRPLQKWAVMGLVGVQLRVSNLLWVGHEIGMSLPMAVPQEIVGATR